LIKTLHPESIDTVSGKGFKEESPCKVHACLTKGLEKVWGLMGKKTKKLTIEHAGSKDPAGTG